MSDRAKCSDIKTHIAATHNNQNQIRANCVRNYKRLYTYKTDLYMRMMNCVMLNRSSQLWTAIINHPRTKIFKLKYISMCGMLLRFFLNHRRFEYPMTIAKKKRTKSTIHRRCGLCLLQFYAFAGATSLSCCRCSFFSLIDFSNGDIYAVTHSTNDSRMITSKKFDRTIRFTAFGKIHGVRASIFDNFFPSSFDGKDTF